KGVAAREELEKATADRAVARAAIDHARAGFAAAKLNLDFTKVRAPINGRLGRRLLDPGNLVKADDTLLATITDADPLYVYFETDERTYLRARRAAKEGKFKLEEGLSVGLALADE